MAVFVVIEILRRSEYENVAWILDLVAHGLVASWFLNLFTVGMPV